jgi:hypothetical protein
VNAITSGIGGVQRARLPLILPTDVDALCAGILCCSNGDPSRARVVRIKNTLELAELEVSESLLDEVRNNPRLDLLSEPAALEFDADGNLVEAVSARAAAAAH